MHSSLAPWNADWLHHATAESCNLSKLFPTPPQHWSAPLRQLTTHLSKSEWNLYHRAGPHCPLLKQIFPFPQAFSFGSQPCSHRPFLQRYPLTQTSSSSQRPPGAMVVGRHLPSMQEYPLTQSSPGSQRSSGSMRGSRHLPLMQAVPLTQISICRQTSPLPTAFGATSWQMPFTHAYPQRHSSRSRLQYPPSPTLSVSQPGRLLGQLCLFRMQHLGTPPLLHENVATGYMY